MGEWAKEIVLFLVIYPFVAFTVGVILLVFRYHLKITLRPKSYIIFNKMFVPLWLIVSLLVTIVAWIRLLKEVR